MERRTLVRLATFLATVVAAWGVLSLGSSITDDNLVSGALADRTYTAQRSADVEDVLATAVAKQEARAAVPDEFRIHPDIEDAVRADIEAVFNDLEANVIAEAPEIPEPETPILEPPPTTAPSGDTGEGDITSTTAAPLPALLTGVVYLDIDGDGGFNVDPEAVLVDVGLNDVPVLVDVFGQVETVMTDVDGAWSLAVDEGPVIVTYDHETSAIPEGFIPSEAEGLQQVVECVAGEQCTAADVGFVVNLVPVDQVAALVSDTHLIPLEAVLPLAETAANDVIRNAVGDDSRLRTVRNASIARVNQEFGLRITNDELTETRVRLTSSPPQVFYDDLPPESDKDTVDSGAAGVVVATFIQPNYLVNATVTEDARQAAADAVSPVVVPYSADQEIVEEGEPLSQLHIDAISATASLVTGVQGQGGLLAVIAVLAGLLGLYLSRFRPEYWSRPRMVALLGILLVLAAASVRGTVVLHEATSWYVLPAVAFGFMTAVLFDSRIAVLMSLAVGILAAVGAQDTGLVVYATLATLAPVPFVSSVSSRGAFRNAVFFSSLAASVIAGATSWFFHAGPNDVPFTVMGWSVDLPLGVVGEAMAWAFGVSIVASLVGLAALQFFESAFDITTALSLLDLTDRNHEALQLLQEEAFGTFNHSLMVGTLAHAAARAIGANALLARAMAYYHDLGKTENPTFFIENQFGMSNPHDQLAPAESATVIRQHVTDGVALARRFKIPSDVAEGIVTHHGDGVMRYFYEKAREQSGEEMDLDDFRHIGHKPRTAETAIVMLADSLEAACRAVFQTEEPTPDAIEKVVGRVIDEKLEDSQLKHSPLTLAELTKIREAFLDSLVGHYHQRIAYPNFPGS